jgi:hypothetical protein
VNDYQTHDNAIPDGDVVTFWDCVNQMYTAIYRHKKSGIESHHTIGVTRERAIEALELKVEVWKRRNQRLLDDLGS